jgi:RNA polymerase sigma-70 factor (ECF subfamily)
METIIDHDAEIKRALIRDFDNGFTNLVRTYQPSIYAGARRLTRGPEDGADVAQETFMRAYRALGTYSEQRVNDLRLKPWLWTITLNLCRSRWQKPRETALPEHLEPQHLDPDSSDDLAWQHRLSHLTNPQRTAVVLRYVLDLSVPDIAEATGRPQGTIKSDIARGLDRLRRTIEAEAHR